MRYAAKLEEIPLSRAYQAEVAALARLHLYTTGRTHEILAAFSREAQGAILRHGERLDSTRLVLAQGDIHAMWDAAFGEWVRMFSAARREAARMAFGLLILHHERMVRTLYADALQESGGGGESVFEPQVDWILGELEAASPEEMAGIPLSHRIWRLNNDTKSGINAVLIDGLEQGKSAWDIAQALEQFLAANERCPRWTEERLRLSKSEIASGDLRGLLSGKDCDAQGVAYRALLLARTEIQRTHAAAIDAQMAASPWVKREKINLSPAHPKRDICDDVAEGGEGGAGVYRVGHIRLPLHPNCLCYKTAVSMSDEEFAARMRGWLNGEPWDEMDRYADFVGGNLGASLLRDAAFEALGVWLFGGKDEMEGRLEG